MQEKKLTKNAIHSHATLVDAPVGLRLRIRQVQHTHPGISTRLREMGFYEDAIVRCLMKGHGNMICEIQNSRVGLDNNLARTIVVSAHE
jgi:Fe2+ transport system protein FeoA